MALIQTLMAVGLIIFIGYLVKVTSKPPKFPPGPFKLPLIGSLLCMFMSGSSATPSLLHSFQDVAGKYGPLVGFSLAHIRLFWFQTLVYSKTFSRYFV